MDLNNKGGGDKVTEKKASEKGKKVVNNIKCKMKECAHENATGGCFYFLGFIGALVYYVTTAPSFWDAVLGFFKAIFWPAFLVHGLLLFIGA